MTVLLKSIDQHFTDCSIREYRSILDELSSTFSFYANIMPAKYSGLLCWHIWRRPSLLWHIQLEYCIILLSKHLLALMVTCTASSVPSRRDSHHHCHQHYQLLVVYLFSLLPQLAVPLAMHCCEHFLNVFWSWRWCCYIAHDRALFPTHSLLVSYARLCGGD